MLNAQLESNGPAKPPGGGEGKGLMPSELEKLRVIYGRNVFHAARGGGFLRIIGDILKEPMFLVLLIACGLYFVLGEWQEGFMMLAAMGFVAAISIYQEVKSSRSLEALREYVEPRVMVIRGGKEEWILSEDLLPGDLMILEEGNRVPADARVIQSNDLSVNEAVITGESLPVDKQASGENNLLYQGTTINSGKCQALVSETGNRTVLGKLGKSISTVSGAKTLLQDQIGRFVKVMASIGFLAFALIWAINYLHSGQILESLLLGLTLIMSAVPEEIPVAFSSFMALGAFHMARRGIITRQPQTIENLGAVNIICLDKTGTVTENKMKVRMIYSYKTDRISETILESDSDSLQVLLYARLASETLPFDAMEKAIVEAFRQNFGPEEDSDYKMVHEYPLSGQPPMMTHIYRRNGEIYIAAKGAPERILRICRLDDGEREKTLSIVRQMASAGYRVLGVSGAHNHVGPYPEQQDGFSWTFAGLVALYDPPRENISEIFKTWYAAGIRIKLVTGDYAETAMNIARQAGILTADKCLLGDQVMQMSPAELNEATGTTDIFARMFPEAKLKLVDSLKAHAHIVAMTGDGVNDGPALKSAHIGIAMGNRGTEMAKEAADLILTDDNLDKITEAIQQGRKIYNNLKKAIRYIISIHIPIILTVCLPLVLGWTFPNIFTPIHVIFLELIMGPTCSVFYEREPVESNLMLRKPRPHGQNMFSFRELIVSFVQGFVIASGILALDHYFMIRDYPLEYVRNIVFTTLILSNVFLTFVNRSFYDTIAKTIRYRNNLVPYLVLLSVGFLAAIQFIPILSRLFEVVPISLPHFFICLITALVCTFWFELYKAWRQTRRKKN